jgi:hypothetical protein
MLTLFSVLKASPRNWKLVLSVRRNARARANGCVGIEGREANGGWFQSAISQHWRTEIESAGKEGSGRGEVVGLLRLGKYIGYVVALVAPCVLVRRRKENAVGGAKCKPGAGQVLRDSNAGREVVFVRISTWIELFAADEDLGHAVLEYQI